MKKQKAKISLFILLMGISIFFCSEMIHAEAKVKMSETKLTLTVGTSQKLVLRNIKKKQQINWSSSKVSVAVVNQNGKVTAKKSGKAVISAKVGKRSYHCKVTVKMKEEKEENSVIENSTQEEISSGEETMPFLSIQIGNKEFPIVLYDNETTKELLKQFPMTIQMNELNGNEKYYYMNKSFPTNQQSVESIHTGELMLYGSDCLVLFYENFKTSYKYTKLGYIEDISGLSEALGKGSIQVTFSQSQK